jgi:hypothetical protein
MRLFLSLFVLFTPAMAAAETFQRPIPAPQTAEAEISYLVASILLVMALVAVQWLIARK